MSRFFVYITIAVLALLSGTVLLANLSNGDPVQPQTGISATTNPQDSPKDIAGTRGQLLYENHCTTCHDSSISIRENRKARSLADIHQWTERWSQQLNLEWSSEEINDVTDFLNEGFYHFPH